MSGESIKPVPTRNNYLYLLWATIRPISRLLVSLNPYIYQLNKKSIKIKSNYSINNLQVNL